MSTSKKSGKRGRPAADLNLVRMEELCAEQCTDEEIAAELGVEKKTIQRRKADPKFLEVMERGKAKGRVSLRHAQFQAAIAGNTTMQIWLGKQLLGQTDKMQVAGDEGGPLKLVIEYAVEAPKSEI